MDKELISVQLARKEQAFARKQERQNGGRLTRRNQ
jgi:hypothetical protein